MTDRFEICVAFLLEHECVYKQGRPIVEHDPHDPGGTTFCGIDQRSHPHIDIAQLTIAATKELYRAGEWTQMRCANLKPAWDLAVLDAAVNIGRGRAALLLQQAVEAKVDGFIGPKTIAAVNNAALDVLGDYIDLRESYYRALPDKLRSHYLNGWLNRLSDLRTACGLSRPEVERVRSAA